ncbi:restriction endonuclease subunit S [Gilliamella sp. Pas-s27]|nr:restriction endonuclease subunit S [Gilliamella sp. Pas-s27]
MFFSNGKSTDKNNGNIPIYGGNGILGYTSKSNFSNILIIGRVGAYCGSVHIEPNDCWVSDNAIAAIPNPNSYNYYNYYLLQSLQLNSKKVGSSQPLLTQSILNNISVKIELNKEKQKKIVFILEKIDKKIELNNQINAELESMAKTLYDYWFVQFDFPDENGKPYKSSGGKMVYNSVLKREIPEGWEVDSLEKHLIFKRGISYKSTDISGGDGLPFINLNSFSLNGQFKFDGTKFFSGKYKIDSLYSCGELVIAVTDVTRNADIIGKAFIIPNVFDKVLISCDVASVKSQRLNKFFLEQLFNSYNYHNYIKYFASGTLVLHLNLDGINWFYIALPPLSLLEKYEEYCAPILTKKSKILEENNQLKQFRDFLLPMLMNGQVTIKD